MARSASSWIGMSRRWQAGRIVTWALLAASLGWVAALLATPLVANGGTGSPAWPAAIATYAVGSRICHQRGERSFRVGNAQMPVCARCTGLYLGAPVGLAWSLCAWRVRRPAARPPIGARRLVLAAAAPTLVSLALEASALVPISGALRAVLAAPLAAVVAWTAGEALLGGGHDPVDC